MDSSPYSFPRKPLPILLLLLLLPGCESNDHPVEPVSGSGAEISIDFEGASLESWSEVATGVFNLRIRKDSNSDFARWYSFRVKGAQGQALSFRIMNAGSVSAADAFSFNQPAVSADDGESWGRIADSDYSVGVFSFGHTMESQEEWIALGPVYNVSRWQGLVDQIQDHPMVTSVEIIAKSLQGRPLHLVAITDPSVPSSEKSGIWAIARQHPGEVGGSWMAEGLLQWLLSEDAEARALLKKTTFYLVPLMNPDGVALGNYRVNSAGANLNREWDHPDPDVAPTVAAVADRIQTFVSSGRSFDFFVDFHAYSSLRKNFFYYSGRDRAPAAHVQEMEALMARFQEINGDFTRDLSSPSSDGKALARGWVFETFGTRAVTFECSYQDVTYGPHAGEYMTVQRYKALGADLGRALAREFFD